MLIKPIAAALSLASGLIPFHSLGPVAYPDQQQNDTTETAPATVEPASQKSTQTASGPILHTGRLAVERTLADEEQKAGHKLMTLDFDDEKNTVFISFAPEYNLTTDGDHLKAVAEAAQTNGYKVLAER